MTIERSRWPGSAFYMPLLLLGCPEPRGAEHPRESSALPPHAVATDTQPDTASRAACAPLWPTQVSLLGTLRQEQRFGPPSYGETPSKDERVSIALLELPSKLAVCPDIASSAQGSAVIRVRAVQLIGRVDSVFVARRTGTKVRVFGTLQHQVRSSDYTDILLRVDSIPTPRLQGEAGRSS